ncbi:hypothetical protein MMC25_002976 [Agyrium rufum]|nr:hypothetical protein [Agyrium rufum]
MDPVGVVLGAAGLLGLFTACVDCFEYLRSSRTLGVDYDRAVIKLDIVRLRFTRWGEAVGLTEGDESSAVARLKERIATPDRDFPTIMRLLGQIMALFQQSADTSSRLALKRPSKESREEEGFDAITPNSITFRDLHENMRKLAMQRQKRSTIAQKTKWALYRKRDLEDLVASLTDLVSDLVELAPAKPQQSLCLLEVANLRSKDKKQVAILDDLLHDSASDGPDGKVHTIDDILQVCVADSVEQAQGGLISRASWKRSRAGEGSKLRQGNCVAYGYHLDAGFDRCFEYVVDGPEFAANVVFHQGHNYGSTA